MNAVLDRYDPLVSEFESAEHEETYLAWVKVKIAKSLADPRPNVPHDVAMKRLRATLDKPVSHAAH